MKRLSLITTGFLQVYFVSINTCFLASGNYYGVCIAAFMISLIWSFNVKKVAFGTNTDRILYSAGATGGSLSGLWSANYIMDIILGVA